MSNDRRDERSLGAYMASPAGNAAIMEHDYNSLKEYRRRQDEEKEQRATAAKVRNAARKERETNKKLNDERARREKNEQKRKKLEDTTNDTPKIIELRAEWTIAHNAFVAADLAKKEALFQLQMAEKKLQFEIELEALRLKHQQVVE